MKRSCPRCPEATWSEAKKGTKEEERVDHQGAPNDSFGFLKHGMPCPYRNPFSYRTSAAFDVLDTVRRQPVGSRRIPNQKVQLDL